MTIENEDEIKSILLDILTTGLLGMRVMAQQGLMEECFLEANHLHNLPGLIKSFKWELLLYYWNIERPGYLSRTTGSTAGYQKYWDKLEAIIETEQATLPIR